MTPHVIVWLLALGLSLFAFYKEKSAAAAAITFVALLLFLGAAGVLR